jgi:hypothetical protein
MRALRAFCHPESAQRGEGPLPCNRCFLGAGIRRFQLWGLLPSARLGMTGGGGVPFPEKGVQP